MNPSLSISTAHCCPCLLCLPNPAMSIVPTDSADGDANLSEFFNRQHQLFQGIWDGFSSVNHFPHILGFPFPISSARTVPYTELAVESDGARLECKEIPEAYLFVADLPGVERDQVLVQVEDGALRISGGTCNWRLKLPSSANLDLVGSSMENGVLTVLVPKVEAWAAAPPPRRNVRVVEITGSD